MLFHIYLLNLYDNYCVYIYIYILYIVYVSNQHHVGLGCQCHQVKSAADMEVMFDMSKKEQVSGRHTADPARKLQKHWDVDREEWGLNLESCLGKLLRNNSCLVQIRSWFKYQLFTKDDNHQCMLTIFILCALWLFKIAMENHHV